MVLAWVYYLQAGQSLIKVILIFLKLEVDCFNLKRIALCAIKIWLKLKTAVKILIQKSLQGAQLVQNLIRARHLFKLFWTPILISFTTLL